MRENEELTGLFRKRLDHAEMTVSEGFWEKLQNDLTQPAATNPQKAVFPSRFHRVAAAASVVFALGAASAAFWYFSPKEEIQKAFTQVAALTPEGSLKGDVAQENFPSIHQSTPTARKSGIKHPLDPPAAVPMDADEEESLSLRLSITITQRVYGSNRQTGNGFYGIRNSDQNPSYQPQSDYANASADTESALPADEETILSKEASASKPRNWALKAALGTALPKGNLHMPLTAGVSLERRFNKCLSLEAGLQYNRLSGNGILHTLGIPAKLNLLLASTPNVDFYATVGGAAEKCLAGAPDNGFEAEPIQFSLAAGLGVRYKMNDRFALFAEPSVSYHFDTDSKTRTLRTERPANLNLLCGVRMTY